MLNTKRLIHALGIGLGILLCVAVQAAASPTIAPAPSAPLQIAPDAQLILSTTLGEILSSADGSTFQDTGLKGDEATLSPDGTALAYTRKTQIYVLADGTERALNGYGTGPTWSPDGRLLSFARPGDDEGWLVYRYRNYPSSDHGATRAILQVGLTDGPASIDPVTRQMLIAEILSFRKTALYTIDPTCTDDSECRLTRNDVATVPYTVNWVSYQPDGSHIVFSEDDGNIYLLEVATGQVKPLVVDKTDKWRPVFSPDSTRLAYLDSAHQLYILRLADKKLLNTPTRTVKIASVDWVKKPATVAPPTPEVATEAAPVSFVMAEGTQMLVATADGRILSSADTLNFQDTGLRAAQVSVAPDGQTLVYTRGSQVFISQGGREAALNIAISTSIVQWSADGKQLLMISTGYADNLVSRRGVGTTANTSILSLLSLPRLSLPLLTDPQTGRFVLAQVTGTQQTDIFTIDPLCKKKADCLASRQDLIQVPYTVNWMSFAPDGSSIAFSEDNGNLYLLLMSAGQVVPLLEDSTYKYGPVFSPDGSQLAYLDDSYRMTVMRLQDKQTYTVPGLRIASISWVTPRASAQATLKAVVPTTVPTLAGPTPTPNIQFTMPAGAKLLVSTPTDDLLVSTDGKTFKPTGLHGHDIAVAPGGAMLAYVRGDRVFIYQAGRESDLGFIGPLESPVWGTGETLLLYLARTASFVEVIRSGVGSKLLALTSAELARVTDLSAPLVFDPVSDRALIADQSGDSTDLSLLDPLCEGATCYTAIEQVGTVNYVVTGLTYYPDGESLIFSEEKGGLYTLTLKDMQVKPLLVDGKHHVRPALNADGTQLAYIDAGTGQLAILHLATGDVDTAVGVTATSVAWVK